MRSPAKSCPNLYRLFDEAEPRFIAAFLGHKSFERMTWLKQYKFDPESDEGAQRASEMLRAETRLRLSSLETEAVRIINIVADRGEYVLEGLARSKLEPDEMRDLLDQRDLLARSLWAYTRQHALFEAVENSLHLRMYRRYDKHYQTFLAEPSDGGPDADSLALKGLLGDLQARLDRGEGYSIDKFDIPGDGDEPPAEMYLIFHPDPPKSVREIDDEGNRSRIYFRPPGEAMVVYTPSTGRVHVRAGSRRLRHVIAERFIEDVLDQPYSSQPADFQAYDISRFLTDLELEMPGFDDVVVERAKVIRVDLSIGNLSNRLSLSTTIDQDIGEIIRSQPGLQKIIEQALAIRFVEIAVRYRRPGADQAQTLDFSMTDRNTCSLLSIDDPFEKVFGHRLLRSWNILRDGRAPSEAESMAVIPALLAIWDNGEDKVSGAWLHARGVDPRILVDLGFLVLAGWDGDDVLDDEDDFGEIPANAREMVEVTEADGQTRKVARIETAEGNSGPGNPELYRQYRVRDRWVEQDLKTSIETVLDAPSVEKLGDHLYALGTLSIDGSDVPIYLARCLDREKVRTSVDTALRARDNLGVGLVLQAGSGSGQFLGTNVLTSFVDHLDPEKPEIAIVADKLRTVFRRHRILAKGGQAVTLTRSGEEVATLFVPGRGSIDIIGKNRIDVIARLVDAHNSGQPAMKTADLVRDIAADQSLSNIFKQPLWDKLKGKFLHSQGPRGPWQIAV